MSGRETEHERRPSALSRRGFLAGTAASAAWLAAGCGGDGTGTTSAAPTGSAPTSLGPTTTRHAAKLARDPFGLGVASGDPAADSVILWARLTQDPLTGPLGGLPADKIDVVWEIAADDRFTKVVDRGVATADPEFAHALHVDVGGLEPGTDYHYRFTVGDFTSPAGRTRTLPTGSPARFAIGVANCQWREAGHYAAYRAMAEDDLDLVLHLGDYIYEFAGNAGDAGDRPTAPDHLLLTLDDYRLRYASYRLDPHLRAAHAQFPFVCTWDDHEVANNYMGDTVPSGADAGAVRDQKAAAYRAWWENIPTRLPAPDGSDLAVYQALAIGDLARLVVLDQRQDADLPPCRDNGPSDIGDCDERLGQDRTRLGADQEEFVRSELARGDVAWSLLGNPVVLAGIDAGAAESAFYLDTWDGYPQARERLIAQLADAPNPVVLTGDYHAGMVLDVHASPFDTGSAVVAPEFMAPPISSPLFPQDISGRTPHLREQLNRHGYLGVVVEPERLTATFNVVTDVADAASAVTVASTWQVDAGDPVAHKR